MGIFGRNPFIGRASGVGSGDAAKAAAVRSIYAPGLSGPGAQTPKYGYTQGAGVNLQPFMGQIGANGRYGAVDLTPGQDGTWGINGQGKMGWGDLVGGLGGVYGGMDQIGGAPAANGQIGGGQGMAGAPQLDPGIGSYTPFVGATKYYDKATGQSIDPSDQRIAKYTQAMQQWGQSQGPYPAEGRESLRQRGMLSPQQQDQAAGQVPMQGPPQGIPGTFGGGIGGGPSPYGATPDNGTPLGDVGQGDQAAYADNLPNFYQG